MMDGSIDTVEPEEGDFFEGVSLETCRDYDASRGWIPVFEKNGVPISLVKLYPTLPGAPSLLAFFFVAWKPWCLTAPDPFRKLRTQEVYYLSQHPHYRA